MKTIYLLLVFILLTGCQNGESEPAEKKAAADNAAKQSAASDVKVTFIELGSVNCIPCKMMKPVMEYVEQTYPEQVKVVFHDVWTPEGRPYAEKYGIRSIPTQVFLDAEGNEYYRHEGFFSKEELVEVLKKQGVK